MSDASTAVTERPLEDGSGPPRFPVADLHRLVVALFRALGLSEEESTLSATFLLKADERGIESHGLARLPYYASRFARELITLNAPLSVVHETASTIAFDGNNGFGLVVAPRAMARCIEKALESGICLATVRHSNHFGIAGAYALMAAERGLGGMAMTNSSPLVVPLHGSHSMLGTNPLAFAVPTGPDPDDPPLVVDLATSTVAWGKIEVARRANSPIPSGWALDGDGRPTTDPHAARHLTPLGGDKAHGGHKGYALATMVDTFCGPLAGAAWSLRISGAAGGDHDANTGHAFMAWRIDALREPAEFYAEVQDMIRELRATPAAASSDGQPVLMPGDPELEAERVNRALGVPVRPEVLAELEELAQSLNVPFDLNNR